MTSQLAAYVLLSFSILLIRSTVLAHSTLAEPRPYSIKECPSCEYCIQPNTARARENMNNMKNNPEVTWKRGQTVPIRWLKNNHEGGFIRLSMVPVSKMLQKNAHTHFAFYHGCWEQNVHPCGNRDCGSDTKGVSFRRNIVIPDVIPNGVYVLAYMWYGGLSESRRNGRYGLFTSCSFVRIKGGNSVVNKFQPVFRPGSTGRYTTVPFGKCFSSSDDPSSCKRGCENKGPLETIPKIFKNGKKPASIFSKEYST